MQIRPSQIPPEVVRVTESLEKAGFEAWIVGGCVRDLLLGRTPKDWDVTTYATPEEVHAAFPHTYYTNEFWTVGVVNDPPAGGQAIDESLKVIEVTPYRLEGKYSDARRPDSVQFSRHIEDDLKRRDFTINALACSRGPAPPCATRPHSWARSPKSASGTNLSAYSSRRISKKPLF